MSEDLYGIYALYNGWISKPLLDEYEETAAAHRAMSQSADQAEVGNSWRNFLYRHLRAIKNAKAAPTTPATEQPALDELLARVQRELSAQNRR